MAFEMYVQFLFCYLKKQIYAKIKSTKRASIITRLLENYPIRRVITNCFGIMSSAAWNKFPHLLTPNIIVTKYTVNKMSRNRNRPKWNPFEFAIAKRYCVTIKNLISYFVKSNFWWLFQLNRQTEFCPINL